MRSAPLLDWTPPPPQFSDPSMHRREDHQTSIDAAERVAEHKSALQGEILAAFVQLGPMTDGELERLDRFKHLGRTTARKRRGELVRVGKDRRNRRASGWHEGMAGNGLTTGKLINIVEANLIEVNANMFRAAAECQSTEETRYYLNGVHIAPHPEKGATLTATDGHRLMSLHDVTGKCSAPKIVKVDPKAIDAKTYSALLKAMPNETPSIHIDDDGIVTVGTYRSLKSCFVDGTYPDWPKVVAPILAKSREGKYSPASYNQKYVAAFGKIATMLSPTNDASASIRIISFTEHDPSLIRFSSADYAFGVLMPMRSSIANEIPIWMKPILEPAPPKATEPAPVPAKPAAKAKRPVARRPAAKRKPARPAKKTAKRRAA